jgi:hypothetical protein
MKIFAKRKRKAAPAGPRTSFASDPVVEELLTKDPSEWNAKQKRMIKRYQDRKAEHNENNEGDETEETNDADQLEAKDDSPPAESSSPTSSPKPEKEEKPVDEKEQNGSDSSDGDDSESDDSKSDDDSESKEKEEGKTPNDTEMPNNKNPDDTEETPEKDTAAVTESSESAEEGKVSPGNDIWKLLDKLNSKTKRTLSRKLERLGASVLQEVRTEASQSLGFGDGSSKKRGPDDTEEEGQGKKKKGKKEVDLSKLPPEERLRREEQKKKQKEAAERRAKGEDKTPGYKHPLNSERRRANRRKPKWKKEAAVVKIPSEKNEHNTSGFLVRKHKDEY